MTTINVTIAGISPLLMNRFTDAAAEKATNGSRGAIVTGDRGSPREQAEARVYRDDAGRACIPQPNIFRCLIDGGAFFKAGKSKVTTQKSSLIPACVAIEGTMLPLKFRDDWQVDVRPVRIPATGGRILCCRPIFYDWSLAFVMELDEDMLNTKLARDILDAAGKRIGLGDFRPACKGPYGRFVVDLWKVETKPLKAVA